MSLRQRNVTDVDREIRQALDVSAKLDAHIDDLVKRAFAALDEQDAQREFIDRLLEERAVLRS